MPQVVVSVVVGAHALRAMMRYGEEGDLDRVFTFLLFFEGMYAKSKDLCVFFVVFGVFSIIVISPLR